MPTCLRSGGVVGVIDPPLFSLSLGSGLNNTMSLRILVGCKRVIDYAVKVSSLVVELVLLLTVVLSWALSSYL